MGEDGYGGEACAQCSPVGCDVNAVGKSADYHYIACSLGGDVLHEPCHEVGAVDGGMACADDGYEVGVVEVAGAEAVEHQGGVVALEEAIGIVRVEEVEGGDGVGAYEFGLCGGAVEGSAAE